MKTHDITTLPRWAQKQIEALQERVNRAEKTIPWTKPGMDWFTVLHPDHRAPIDKDRHRKLFILGEDHAHAVCSVGPTDFVFVGRGRSNARSEPTAPRT